MRNIEIATLFNRIADLLQIQGANPFRVRAYQRAAANLESLTDNIEAIVSRGSADEMPGIGKDLASKISEYVATGKVAFYEDLMRTTTKISITCRMAWRPLNVAGSRRNRC